MMQAPSYNPAILERVRGVRSTFELRWNPTARRLSNTTFSATGEVIAPEFEGRYELWDRTDDSPEYRVMTLQWPDGSYRHPDDWLPDLLYRIDPARYGGSIPKLMEVLVDRAEEVRERVHEDDWDDFCEMLAKWAHWLKNPKEPVLTDIA